MNQKLSKQKIIFFHDAIVASLSYPLALVIRHGSLQLETFGIDYVWQICAAVFLVKLVVFYLMKMNRGIWRFSSLPDLILIIKTVSLAVAISPIVIFFLTNLQGVPRSSFIIDWFIMIFVLGGSRLTYRLYKDGKKAIGGHKTIIIGAGKAGEQLVREIKTTNSPYVVTAILDDDAKKRNRTLHGILVDGPIDKLAEVVEQTGARNVFIAIPTADSAQIRRFVELCEKCEVTVQILPGLTDIADGKVTISQLREVDEVDLLGRNPVQLDATSLGEMLSQKTVMVTGAGGSIGSELCSQILKFKPKSLITFENCEYFLYQLEMNLKDKLQEVKFHAIIGDVKDNEKVEEVISEFRPDIILHAAAYKHVPMMEHNPHEAVKTNIGGTLTLVRNALKFQVNQFVMISTDKAVNPTNIMGATKRVAEMICQHYQTQSSSTKFTVVRFGNVLGSAGSVIPLFKTQIKNGGPVTVTHPDITRFFMSIPEATQLVLQAATLGKGGEISVLDMGEPVKIVDLAKDLIKFSGLKPDKDIKIVFTGLRPGEKLFEELLADEENTLPTEHPMVRTAAARIVSEQIVDKVESLINLSATDKQEAVIQLLKDLLPEYQPNKSTIVDLNINPTQTTSNKTIQ